MKKRTVTGILGALVTVPLIVIGGLPLALFGGLIGILAALEMAALVQRIGISVQKIVVTGAAFLFIILPVWLGESGTAAALVALIIFSLAAVLLKKHSFDSAAGNIFTSLYAGFLLSRFIALRELPGHGLYLAILVLVVVWMNDICAYFGGKLLGRRKLAPTISPNKTIEGAIFGMIGGLFAGGLIFLFYGELAVQTIAISVLAGFMAQFGDLFESQFKRWAKVKDSGSLFPGHGGVLDRIDGLVFASAISYYVSLLFMMSSGNVS